MRWIGRSLVALAFLLSLWFAVIPGVYNLWRSFGSTSGDLENARASIYFPLDRTRWLTFDVPRQAGSFRFYAHAALNTADEAASVSYIVEYQWLNENGDLLLEKQHHITTRASAVITPSIIAAGGDTRVTARFYDHRRSYPSRDHALYLAADQQPTAHALRLRVSSMDPEIVEVGVRAYQLHERSAQDLDIAWQRMSLAQRETLSNGSLYPSFLLSELERKNLLSSFWKPIGPLGVMDKDFQIETLYQREAARPAPPPETPSVGSLYASPDHRVTLTLDETEARYRIEWQPLSQLDEPPGLQLQWQGNDPGQQLQWQADLHQNSWEGPMAAGLLQLVADQAVSLKFLIWKADGWQDLAPEKLYSRAFNCSADAPLNYPLAPGASPQSLRIDARGFVRQDGPAAMARSSIHLQVRDKSGAVSYGETLELSTNGNPYQQFHDAASVPSRIFERSTSFLDAAASAQSLHITCEGQSLVNVFSRPWRHAVRRRLPADANRLHAYQHREPAWFLLQPENVDALVRQKRVSSLVWYFSPREINGLIADSYYNRQTLVTENVEAPEWQVFSHHESDSQSRMDARASAFQPLETAANLIFAGHSNETQLRPSVVYERSNSEPDSVQIWIDHALALETTIAGSNGRIRLPYLKAGQHHVEIRSKPASWYINNTAEAGQTHLLRTAYSMSPAAEGSSLTFSVVTSGAQQQLGFWLFAPGDVEILNCRLLLEAQRAENLQSSHTLLGYNYQLHSSEYQKSFVLQRKEGVFRGPMRLVMGLDSDLPAQTATARLSCDQPGVLASAGIISRGLSAYRAFREPHDA